MLVCPGDHYSMSELPHAHVTGSILATALAFNYRLLFPEFPKPSRTFSQRRAVEKLTNGVDVFLHSKRGKYEFLSYGLKVGISKLFIPLNKVTVYNNKIKASMR